MKRHRRLIAVALLLMVAPLCYAVISFAARPAAGPLWLEPPTPNTTCVLPKSVIRYEHMNHLKDLRDQVMREGRREQLAGARPLGLGSCRGCHAHKEQFCDRCHDRASVRLDCFGCHQY